MSAARHALPVLMLVLTLAAHPARAADSTATVLKPDFTEYQKLLNDDLSVISPKRTPLDSRFDYALLFATEGLIKRDVHSERLRRIHEQLTAVPPSRMSDWDRIAWAINTYNYLVIETASVNLIPRVAMKDVKRFASVRDMNLQTGAFFDAQIVEVEGVKYSLNTFERHFLFADYLPASGPPPSSIDPRVHFALVCGALGCPPLQPRAFKGDSLERQLEFATRNALKLPRHLRWNENPSGIEGSEIFDWYIADFGGAQKALAFALRYADGSLRGQVKKWNLHEFTRYIAWDWNLNQVDRRRNPKSPSPQGTSG